MPPQFPVYSSIVAPDTLFTIVYTRVYVEKNENPFKKLWEHSKIVRL